ncbi:DUF6804 family protein [Mesorhizobium sp. LSHC412B00]|uniref:DUF6804 family protein n=1 Tax=Mesorhizobium sp. LSHC412B00 TaxID=1287285 RepID=UPI0003CE595E|nr:DUF6804 family protein [Mesorhizobium sp. LSHC412B00]ESX85294.1 hypothetical protein X756_22615 [Mesorhizobium sp. LSHC412B00]
MTKHQAALIPAVALVLALAPWPYAYYQLLRVVVTVWAVAIAWDQYQLAKRWTPWVISFAAVAALFNPIAPIYLVREVWAVFDLVGAAVFATFGLTGWSRKDTSKGQ